MNVNPRVEYEDTTDAFLSLVRGIYQNGYLLEGKKGLTKEINSISFSVVKPLDRVHVIPNRRNNIFMTIAQSLWVLAGRNDVDFLVRYLPRAIEFSDDGKIWMGGYGSRIRNWRNSVDQVGEVYRKLKQENISRQAVISIFDPEIDFQISKDVPCTNWLDFICRNSNLDLNVALRSNDLFWGFSGINAFEWSLLQEMMAYWIGVSVGSLHFFVGSMHYYERHFDAVLNIVRNNNFKTVYDYGFESPRFCTSFDSFDTELQKLFEVEGLMRLGKWDYKDKYEIIKDPFLRHCLQLMGIYNYYLGVGLDAKIGGLFGDIVVSDLRLAGIEFFMRKYKTLGWVDLNETEKEFLIQFGDRK